VRYFNGGIAGTGGLGTDSDSGIEEADQDDDNSKDREDANTDISTTPSSRLKGHSTSGDSSTKSGASIQHQHQNLPPPPSTTSWSPPPPISFRSEQQQQQQQHRVTHGPGGE